MYYKCKKGPLGGLKDIQVERHLVHHNPLNPVNNDVCMFSRSLAMLQGFGSRQNSRLERGPTVYCDIWSLFSGA